MFGASSSSETKTLSSNDSSCKNEQSCRELNAQMRSGNDLNQLYIGKHSHMSLWNKLFGFAKKKKKKI